MEYGAQIKSDSDVKGDSIVKSIWSKVAITTSYHKCYHKWALVLPTKLHLYAWVYTLYINLYRSFDPRKLWLSASDLTSRRKKHFCPRGWNNLGFAFVAMNPGTKKNTSSGSSRLTTKFLHVRSHCGSRGSSIPTD